MTDEKLKEEVKKFVTNELTYAKRHDVRAVNYRAIAYGALQFCIHVLPEEDYIELARFWSKQYNEFDKIIRS